MYNPKSNKNTDKEVKPAPYADAAVTDEDLSGTETNPEEEHLEDNDLMDKADDVKNESFEVEEIEDIEIEDIDDLDENVGLEEDELEP